jgi:hypothetical protein
MPGGMGGAHKLRPVFGKHVAPITPAQLFNANPGFRRNLVDKGCHRPPLARGDAALKKRGVSVNDKLVKLVCRHVVKH